MVSSSIKAALTEHELEWEDRITEVFRIATFYFTDFTEAEVTANEVVVHIGPMHVLEAEDGEATLSIECVGDYTVYITAPDEETAIYDSEEKRPTYLYNLHGKYQTRVSTLATVRVKYETKNPEKVKVEDVEIEDLEIPIELGDVDFSRDDDE